MTKALRSAVLTGVLAATTANAAGLSLVELLGRPTSSEGTSIAITPDEAFIYATPSFPAEIEVLKVDPVTKIPRFVSAGGADEYYYEGIVVSPDGKHVYATINPHAAPPLELYSFTRDPVTGALTDLDEYDVPTGHGLAIAPNGGQLYVPGDGVLTVFARDASSGELWSIQTLVDGQGGVSGLDAEGSATVTPDGAHVYVTSVLPGSVVAFARDGFAGTLTFVAAYVDEVDGITDLGHAQKVVVSPDGATVHVAVGDGAVSTFARDASTGLLTLVDVVRDGMGGVPVNALRGASGIAVRPDGTEVYIGGLLGDLSVFTRDVTTGALTFVETQHNDGALLQLLVSADGRNVYASHTYSGAMFQRVNVACPAAPAEPCRQPVAPGGSDLKLQKGSTPARNAVKWAWRKGAATTSADLGAAPLATTDFALCVYVGGDLRLQARVPAGGGCGTRACWKAQSSGGYRYTDRLRTPDGVKTLALRPGAAGRAKMTAGLAGDAVELPSMPVGAPVTVQLVNGEGACFGATYSSPTIDGATLYRAKSD